MIMCNLNPKNHFMLVFPDLTRPFKVLWRYLLCALQTSSEVLSIIEIPVQSAAEDCTGIRLKIKIYLALIQPFLNNLAHLEILFSNKFLHSLNNKF